MRSQARLEIFRINHNWGPTSPGWDSHVMNTGNVREHPFYFFEFSSLE